MTQLSIEQVLQIALAHHQAGRLPEAETLYRQILAQQPDHPNALHLLGTLAGQAGRYQEATSLLLRVIALHPYVAETHAHLGEFYRQWDKLDLAIPALRHAIALKGDYLPAYNNLSAALKEQGQFEEAAALARTALALEPQNAKAFNNLGAALAALGKLTQAIAAYRQALTLTPNFTEAHNNLGNALKDQGRHDEAIAAYRKALALKPNFPEACSNLATTLREKGQLDDALAACRQALALKPDLPLAHNVLGVILKDMGRLDEALAAYRQALALKPDYPEAHSNLVLTSCYHPDYGPHALAEENRRWNRQHADPLKKFIPPHANDRNPDRRLRVGYVSADFWGHASAFFLVPLLEHHDPRQLEVFCYAQVRQPDAVTRRLQSTTSQWRDTLGRTDAQIAAQVREDAIDILVDLKLHTAHNNLLVFARKPAPVQATWLGYPGSTGLNAIDYRLSDPYLDPPGMDESVYSERTVRLPDCFWCYDPLDGREVSVNALPALEKSAVTFGCLNNYCKVNDRVLRLWTGVLQNVPASRMLLLAPEGASRQRTLEFLAHEGIDSRRIEFSANLSRRQYLELYHRIDVGLDTFPYNGHTTSLDNFWMGVPVVTLAGDTAVSRAGASQLINLQLPEWIARTPAEYVRIASDLAHDLPRLASLRSILRPRMQQSPLMDAPRFARNVESAFRRMWQTWCAAGS